MFLKQVDCAVDVFDQRFPGVTGIFLFDNAPRHRKFPPDGLNPGVYPGGKLAIMRDTEMGIHKKWCYQTAHQRG